MSTKPLEAKLKATNKEKMYQLAGEGKCVAFFEYERMTLGIVSPDYNFDPMRLALNIIMTAMQMDASKDFQFLQGGKHFDQLIGSNQTRVLLLRSAMSNTSEVTVDSILEMHRKELAKQRFGGNAKSE